MLIYGTFWHTKAHAGLQILSTLQVPVTESMMATWFLSAPSLLSIPLTLPANGISLPQLLIPIKLLPFWWYTLALDLLFYLSSLLSLLFPTWPSILSWTTSVYWSCLVYYFLSVFWTLQPASDCTLISILKVFPSTVPWSNHVLTLYAYTDSYHFWLPKGSVSINYCPGILS